MVIHRSELDIMLYLLVAVISKQPVDNLKI